jgi:hypothetical protein
VDRESRAHHPRFEFLIAAHRAVDQAAGPAWIAPAQNVLKLANIDLARFTLDWDADVARITSLVDRIFSIA